MGAVRSMAVAAHRGKLSVGARRRRRRRAGQQWAVVVASGHPCTHNFLEKQRFTHRNCRQN
jgi:hypothetical protein